MKEQLEIMLSWVACALIAGVLAITMIILFCVAYTEYDLWRQRKFDKVEVQFANKVARAYKTVGVKVNLDNYRSPYL